MKCDAKQFADLYKLIYKDLYRYALCVMKNTHDAEDAVSEAVMYGFEKIDTLKKEDAFKSWMFTILSNVCKKRLAMAAKQTPTDEMDMLEPIFDAEEQTVMNMDLRRAYAILSEEEKMIVGLSIYGGYQSKEIAKILKLKDGTVRSKRSRALQKMSVIITV